MNSGEPLFCDGLKIVQSNYFLIALTYECTWEFGHQKSFMIILINSTDSKKNEWMNENLASRVKVNNWTVTYLEKSNNQFSPI